MKLTSLLLYNFSSHRNTTLTFTKPLSIIVGPLNAGKSSILQAIEYSLCGECGLYRKTNDPRHELVSDGTQGFILDLEMDKGHIRRVRNNTNQETGEWNGQTKPTLRALDSAVIDSIGISKTVLSAALNTSNFFEMTPSDQKQLIIGLVGAEITWPNVQKAFTGEPDAMKLLHGRTVNSIIDLDNAYQFCYDLRRDINRELKALKPPDPPAGTPPPLDKLKTMMTQVEGELQNAIADRARYEGSASVLDLKASLEKRRDALKTIGKPPIGEESRIELALAHAVEARTGTLEQIRGVDDLIVNARGMIVARESNIQLLATFNGRCVAGPHACPAPAADMAAAKTLQENHVAELTAELKTLGTKLVALTKESEGDNAKIYQCGHAANELTANTMRYQEAQKEIADIDAQISKLQTFHADPVRLQTMTDAVLSLRERHAIGKRKIEEAQSWIERERQVKTVAERRKVLEIQSRHAEELVQFFGAKGVKVQLIDQRIGQFVAELNKWLSPFGFALDIEVDPWRIMVKGRSLNRLSRSERFRTGIAFQIAIARMTGLDFIVVDDCELLSPDVRKIMVQMLLKSELDHAIIVWTLMVPPADFVPPNVPNAEWFLVQSKQGLSTVAAL